MIHANRIVTVGEQECIIDRPIILYRGDREVEIEFTLVGNEFMFSEDGNVIKSVNASHGQLVLNTPSGEHMFSELAECHEGKVVFVVTKEMIDEFVEVGFYSFQIRLYDSAEMKSRVTIPPVMNGFDIRNPIAAEDEVNVVDQGLVDYARVFKDQSNEELPTFDWTGAYNKTEWEHHDVITENKMNKIEDALYSINANVKESDVFMLNALGNIKKDADKYVKEHMTEVEADVEEFERNLNTDVQQFKIDTNAAMTAHKNEVSEVVDGFSTQLAHIENGYNTRGVNILDFGAVSNDSDFDNYTSIIEAIKYAVNNGFNAVFIPSGTWYIKGDRPIYLPSNFTLFGTGYSSIIKKHLNSYVSGNRDNANNYATNSIISQGDPFSLSVSYGYDSESQNICIHDICVDGSVLEDTDFSHLTDLETMYALGINLTYSIQPKVYNVEVKNTANTGIYLYRSWGANISNCDIHDCATNLSFSGTTRNGISMSGKEVPGLKANSIDSCRIYRNGDMGIQTCFTPCNITNNVIYDNIGSGIEDDSSFYTNNELGDLVISNNYIRNNKGYGMNLAGSGYATRIISNNIVKYCEQGGIYVSCRNDASDKDNTLITNNIVQKCKTIVDYVHLITYSGKGICTVSYNHLIDNEITSGKEISCTGAFANILNNTLSNNTGTSGGIYANATKIVIDGNYYDNPGHKRLQVFGNVDHLKISNNYFNIATCFLNLVVSKLDTFIYENNTIFYSNNESSFASEITASNAFTIDYVRLANNHLKVSNDWTCGRLIEFGSDISINKVVYTNNDFLDKYASWGKIVNFANTPKAIIDANNIKSYS